MICRSCQAEIPDGSRFCNMCGVSQDKQAKKQAAKKRGNGQGSVYKRGDKWCAAVTVGWYMDGDKKKRKVRRKCGFDRKKDAIAWVESLKANASAPKKANFFAMFTEYQNNEMQTLSASKAKAYEIAWNKISGDIGLCDVRSMTVPQLQQITDARGTSYYTKRDIKNLLSHLYRLAIRDDFADKNKAQFIELPELESKERTVFTEDEIAALWADADQYIVKHILTMIYTGMRPAELLSIKIENIRMDEHYLTGGVKTKKSKARKIIIPDRIRDTLSQLIADAQDGTLSNYIKHQFYDAWNAYRASRGLREELSPYCCRHTYITRLTALKVSPAMLQELAGHEDYDTTLEYTHLSIADRLAEVNRLK